MVLLIQKRVIWELGTARTNQVMHLTALADLRWESFFLYLRSLHMGIYRINNPQYVKLHFCIHSQNTGVNKLKLPSCCLDSCPLSRLQARLYYPRLCPDLCQISNISNWMHNYSYEKVQSSNAILHTGQLSCACEHFMRLER